MHYGDIPNRVSHTSGTEEINLLDYWRVIMKYKKMIAAIVGAASIVAVIASLLMTKIYKAEAVIIPVSSKSGSGGLAALASQFGGLASLAGVNVPGMQDDTQKFVSILKSRTLVEKVINREDLMPILFEDKWDVKSRKWKTSDPKKTPNREDAVIKMKNLVSVMDDKKNKTIKIAGEFRDPLIAARVVNAYLDELQNFINDNALTTAKRNRIFIEGQLAENKRDLLEAGKEINEFYKGNRVSASEAKVDVPIQARDLGFETRESETKLLAMNNPATISNGTVLSNAESPIPSSGIESLIVQKTELDKKIAEVNLVKDVPQQVYLTYLMLRRELLAKINALLTSQYEMAKIEESKEDLSFQIIDKAVPPERRFKPKRAQICIMSFMAALFGAIFLAFFREYLLKMKALSQGR
ncbi:MAG: hypothetical protein JXB42_09990 [Deltaproteobacteria bacterium]|nr:hypothetical protein [Deltaproteobacteria bacterium]